MEDFSFRHRLTLRLLGFFPQILLVALCNSRAMGEADDNSDIDIFIIAKKGNLWIGRFLATSITSLLGVRRKNTHGLQKGTPDYIKRTKDRFCLSFFITEEAMNFNTIRLQPDDPYLDRWIYTLIPLVSKNHVYEHFMEANGVEPVIANDYRECGNPSQLPGFPRVLSTSSKTLGMTGHIFGFLSFFESLIKKLWLPKTLKSYEKLGKPWGVVISDTMLKFHDQDVRREYANIQL